MSKSLPTRDAETGDYKIEGHATLVFGAVYLIVGFLLLTLYLYSIVTGFSSFRYQLMLDDSVYFFVLFIAFFSPVGYLLPISVLLLAAAYKGLKRHSVRAPLIGALILNIISLLTCSTFIYPYVHRGMSNGFIILSNPLAVIALVAVPIGIVLAGIIFLPKAPPKILPQPPATAFPNAGYACAASPAQSIPYAYPYAEGYAQGITYPPVYPQQPYTGQPYFPYTPPIQPGYAPPFQDPAALHSLSPMQAAAPVQANAHSAASPSEAPFAAAGHFSALPNTDSTFDITQQPSLFPQTGDANPFISSPTPGAEIPVAPQPSAAAFVAADNSSALPNASSPFDATQQTSPFPPTWDVNPFNSSPLHDEETPKAP